MTYPKVISTPWTHPKGSLKLLPIQYLPASLTLDPKVFGKFPLSQGPYSLLHPFEPLHLISNEIRVNYLTGGHFSRVNIALLSFTRRSLQTFAEIPTYFFPKMLSSKDIG